MTPGPWRKSSRSGANGGNCVEARLGNVVEVRDSKAPEQGSLAMSRTDFTALLDAVKLYEYIPR